jgi:DNA-binding GntR family transcriptional regulator
MKNFQRSLETGDLKKMAQADVEFHDVIYQATDNQKLINMLNNLREQMYRYRVEYLKNPDNHQQLLDEHEAIYQGIVARDKEAVTAMMREHISNQVDVVKNIIRKQEK